MSIGSGIAFLSIPTVLAIIGHFFSGSDALLASTILGCVGFVQIARVIKAIEFNKSKPASNSNLTSAHVDLGRH